MVCVSSTDPLIVTHLSSHLPVRGVLFFCHGCGHGGHQKCYQDFYRDQPPTDLVNPPRKFLATTYDRSEDEDEDDDESQANETNSRNHSRSESVDGSKHGDDQGRKSPRGRRRDMRRSRSPSVSDGHDTIPEKEAVNYSRSTTASSYGGTAVGGRKGGHDKRSSSALKAEETMTLEEDRGIPDEEYIIVRERETEERETARAELQLFGHHCAAGCGHFCWMAKQ